MKNKQSTEIHSMMHSDSMLEIMELLTEEQKKKVAVMKLE